MACMRVIVVGASGFLGSQLMQLLRKSSEFITMGTSTQSQEYGLLHLDILDNDNISQVIAKSKPNCVINCAAMTNVDQCERNPALAYRINALGPKHLAKVCMELNARLIQISTDSVFDGISGGYTEDSIPNPVNQYGRTKREGEIGVSSIATNYTIIRTNFYGINSQNKHLLNWILNNLRNNKEMVGFDDTIFNPLWVTDLAKCIIELISISYQGLLHCCGNETLSKFQFIQNIAKGLGYTDTKIKRGYSDQVSLVAKRPKNTFLSNTKMRGLLKTKIHTIEEVLQDPSFDNYRTKTTTKI